MASYRPSTVKQYDTYLKKWTKFANALGYNPLSPTCSRLLSFLNSEYKSGLGYSALCTARSAVASLCVGEELGTHRLVKRFLKGVFNTRPSFPKTVSTWDPSCVLKHLKGNKTSSQLTLKELTLKLTMLLALLSAQRVQTLAALDTKHMGLKTDRVVFHINKILKQTRPGTHLPDIELPRYRYCRRLCIVTLLKEYLERTKDLRGDTQLLITFVKPHTSASKSTIARWLKTVLMNCGISDQFTPHSTRSAATSKAFFEKVPIDTIMKSAGWSSGSTFAKHYKKPIHQLGVFSKNLLDAIK